MDKWQSMETAPLDGSPILLALSEPIDSNDAVGWLNHDMKVVIGWHDGPKRFRWDTGWECCFCEEGTADTEGFAGVLNIKVRPVAWMPIPEFED